MKQKEKTTDVESKIMIKLKKHSIEQINCCDDMVMLFVTLLTLKQTIRDLMLNCLEDGPNKTQLRFILNLVEKRLYDKNQEKKEEQK